MSSGHVAAPVSGVTLHDGTGVSTAARPTVATRPAPPLTAIDVPRDRDAAFYRGIADTYGTPCFVLDRSRLEHRASTLIAQWHGAFRHARIYYSYKTNYLPEVCRCLHELGIGADAVSGYELQHAERLAAGLPIVFNGPMKSSDELSHAVRLGAGINIDCEEEIDRLCAIVAPERRDGVRLGVRVNPRSQLFDSDDDSFVDAHLAAQRHSKFGSSIDDGSAVALIARLRAAGFTVRVLHCHLGSQITSARRYGDAARRVLDFLVMLRADGHPIDELNVGGGFGVPGLIRQRRGWKSQRDAQHGRFVRPEATETFDMGAFCTHLATDLDRLSLADDLTIACEPGRWLVSDAMELLTEVVGVKRRSAGNWVIVDGGLNIMPTAAMGERRALRFIGHEHPERLGTDGYLAAIGGPLCYEGDVLMTESLVPESLAAGDLVSIADAGAYTVSRGTNFNRPRAAVVMHERRQQLHEIWARETYDDIFQFATRTRGHAA